MDDLMENEHPFDVLIERIADAVVRKMDEERKIDTVAQAVLAYLRRSALVGQPPALAGATGGAEVCAAAFTAPTATPLAEEVSPVEPTAEAGGEEPTHQPTNPPTPPPEEVG